MDNMAIMFVVLKINHFKKNKMKNLFLFILLLVSINTFSDEFDTTKIKPLFRQWKDEQISKGKFVSSENCNFEYINSHPKIQTNYSFPDSVNYVCGDLNQDGVEDVLYYFHPKICSGGMNDFTEIKLLFISNESDGFTIDDKFIKDAEISAQTQLNGGWIEVIGIRNDTLFFKFRNWAKDDVFEPSIIKYVNVPYTNKAVKKIIKEEKIYEIHEVDIKPIFIGGNQKLMQYLSDNLHYPSLALENELEGRVIIKFYVDINGSIKSSEVYKDGVGGDCADEAIRLVKNMPKWQPALKQNKPVRTYVYLPLDFILPK